MENDIIEITWECVAEVCEKHNVSLTGSAARGAAKAIGIELIRDDLVNHETLKITVNGEDETFAFLMALTLDIALREFEEGLNFN